MAKLNELEPWGDDGELRVIVESPQGSGIKFKYEPSLEVFTVSRAFPLGTIYPFDWGFIPGTQDEDGDPVDALVIHKASTYPGLLLPCKILGMIAIDQKDDKNSKSQCNNRIIAIPMWNDYLGEIKSAKDLPPRIRKEIEQFFMNTSFFTSKHLRLKGWQSRKETLAFLNSCREAFKR